MKFRSQWHEKTDMPTFMPSHFLLEISSANMIPARHSGRTAELQQQFSQPPNIFSPVGRLGDTQLKASILPKPLIPNISAS